MTVGLCVCGAIQQPLPLVREDMYAASRTEQFGAEVLHACLPWLPRGHLVTFVWVDQACHLLCKHGPQCHAAVRAVVLQGPLPVPAAVGGYPRN